MSNCLLPDMDRYAAVFNALSNPHRLQIYSLLSGCCTPGTTCELGTLTDCCVGDLGEHIDIAPSTLSHHLKELSNAGLIDMTRQGKQVMCAVNPQTLGEVREFFNPAAHA